MPNRQIRSLAPIILIGAGAILIAGAVLGLLFLQQRETPAATNPQPQQAGSDRVALSDAKAAFDSGAAVFVDVRSVENYEQAHIPGALSIPLNELETRLGELNPERWIITYCT